MKTESKTHYRKVYKSDHLGIADLEDLIEEKCELKFTIKQVKQEYGVQVAGKKGNFNIAYFEEPIKPLVLNATNSKIIKSFCGGSPFVENWNNVYVELYIDNSVKMKGEVVGGVRIKPIQPIKNKIKPNFTEANFENAKKANATTELIKSKYSITPEMEQKYNEYAKTN